MVIPYLPPEWREGPKGMNQYDRWTPEEIRQLEREVTVLNLPWEEIAARHGRTVQRVKKYAQKKKLKRPKK